MVITTARLERARRPGWLFEMVSERVCVWFDSSGSTENIEMEMKLINHSNSFQKQHQVLGVHCVASAVTKYQCQRIKRKR